MVGTEGNVVDCFQLEPNEWGQGKAVLGNDRRRLIIGSVKLSGGEIHNRWIEPLVPIKNNLCSL